MTSIQEFYRNKVIFITGGTGFVGKVLIEKLLRSCGGIKKIYLLLRDKKGQCPETRLEQFKKDDVFERIREKCPDRFKVLVALFGEISQDQLGLSEESLRQLHEVNIIFHCAASVRFDEPIRRALLKNTKGTYETLEIACRLPFLESFVHVSTTYCVADGAVIEEKIYPAKFDWKKALKAIDTFTEEELDAVCYKFNNAPNTYVFTKGLSENMIETYKAALPLVIFRPSIIFSAEKEPMPGYIANFNGPVGLLVACACGLMRTIWLPKPIKMNMVPIDTCTNGMVVAAYARATDKTYDELPVYNASTKMMGLIDLLAAGKKNVCEHSPPEYILWRPGGWCTTTKTEFYLRFFLTQLIPAILVDPVLKAANREAFLLKIQRTIWYGISALRHYIDREWTIKNDKFLALMKKIPQHEMVEFSFEEKCPDFKEYMKISQAGGRRYLLKQDDSTLEESKRKIKRLVLVDLILKYGIFCSAILFVIGKVWNLFQIE